MKWLLFALGALMILCGGSCIVSGYPIVEVERGWTLTISGAIAMTGGAIVFALGILLVRLERLSKALHDTLALPAREPASPARRFEKPPREFAPAEPSASAAPLPKLPSRAAPLAPPPPPPPSVSEPVQEAEPPPDSPSPGWTRPRPRRTPDFLRASRRDEAGAAAAVEVAEAALSRPNAPAAAEEPAGGAPAPESNAEPPDQPTLAEEAPGADQAPEEAPAPDVSPAPEAPAEPSFHRFPMRSLTLPRGAWPDPPTSAASAGSEEAAAPPPPVEAPQNEAAPVEGPSPATVSSTEEWFERALADLDQNEASAASPESAPASAPEPFEAAAESQEAPQAAPESREPAVIGRYETEGTLYVMYADGSIDAQTATGVYRFESLAALKTHIESLS